MRYLEHITIVMLSVVAVACSGDGEKRASEADINAAKEAARTEAAKVLELSEGTMAQEKAILAVRAHESEIRMAGFEECADSFAAEAQRVMMPVLNARPAVIE